MKGIAYKLYHLLIQTGHLADITTFILNSSGRVVTHSLYRNETPLLRGEGSNSINHIISKKAILTIPRCSSSSDSNGSEDDSSDQAKACMSNY